METGNRATRQLGTKAARPRSQVPVTSFPRSLVAFPRAFTLVEMLVSLAVLSLALTIIGVVFAVATKTTRQAAAYAEANNWTRQFLEQIEEDLKFCESSQSPLVLVGRTQAAALTKDKLDAGRFYRVLTGDIGNVAGNYSPEFNANLDNADPNYAEYSNPRADILMFFTNRPMASQAPPANFATGTLGEACANGARFSPIEVVYGHAALNDPVLDTGVTPPAYDWPLNDNNARHIEQTVDGSDLPDRMSRIPANHWHLSRRATILQTDQVPAQLPYDDDLTVSFEACAALARCQPYPVANPIMPGDGAFFNLPLFLESLGPRFFTASNAPYLSPYFWPTGNPFGLWQSLNVDAINSLLYASFNGSFDQPRFHHVATVIENPPPELQSNLGVHLLPGCAWFQVEFLMPEDPRNSQDYVLYDPNFGTRQDMPRWTQVQPGKTYVFVPDTQANRDAVATQGGLSFGSHVRRDDFAGLFPILNNPPAGVFPNNVANRRIRMWPYAIRVTVRVFDQQGRLEYPLVRSLVHRFD